MRCAAVFDGAGLDWAGAARRGPLSIERRAPCSPHPPCPPWRRPGLRPTPGQRGGAVVQVTRRVAVSVPATKQDRDARLGKLLGRVPPRRCELY